MPALTILLDETPPGLREAVEAGTLIHLANDAEITVGGLEGGMSSGDPSVSLTFKLPDGRVVFAETSLRLFLTASSALKSRFGDPRMTDLSMPEITVPDDFPPRAMIRAAIVSAETARDSVKGETFDLLRRAIKMLKRADEREAS